MGGKKVVLKMKKNVNKIEWIQKVFGVRVYVSAVAAIYYISTPAGGG